VVESDGLDFVHNPEDFALLEKLVKATLEEAR